MKVFANLRMQKTEALRGPRSGESVVMSVKSQSCGSVSTRSWRVEGAINLGSS